MKINMELTEKDADIIAFKNYLPKRKFNETVNRILGCHLKGEMPKEELCFEIDWCTEKIYTKLDLPTDLVKQIKSRFKTKRGNFTTVIKQIIKEYLKENYICPRFTTLEIIKVKTLLESTKEKIGNVRNLYADHPEKHRKRFFAYKSVLNGICNFIERS